MAERKYKDPYREYTDATDVGADKLLLSAEQQAGIDQAKADWQKYSEAGDQAGMDEAHRRAEAIRAQAGYSGGANGGAYNRFADDGGSGVHMSSTHTASPKWTPTYSRERADTLSQIQSRSPFSYDPEKDPTYQQYKAQYERGAQKAMEDTMGQVMARTGGLASSFAQTAGQQAYGSYMAQLADKVPELRQLAYQMYMDEGNRLRSDLQMYDSLDSSDAARWQGTVLSPFQADRAYAKDVEDTLYSRGRDALADSRYEREYADQRAELDYQHGRDALADSRYDQEWDYKTKLDQEARDKALAELLASGGNYSGYQGLYGLSPEDAAKLGALWTEDRDYAKRDADLDLLSKQLGIDLTRKQIANVGKSSGGGGGGTPQSKYYASVQKKAAGYENADDAKAYLERMVDGGYINPEEAAMIYQMDLGGTSGPDKSIPTTREELLKVLPKGITPYTHSEFTARKRTNSSAVADYDSYQDYLQKMYEQYKS